MNFTEKESAGIVAASFGDADPRLRELLQGLVGHLHDYLRETRPTVAEWERAIDFLTRTGKACTDTRQEFILLSDLLGVSMLVETMNGADAHSADATASTVVGPFHQAESPVRALGDGLYPGRDLSCVVRGTVTDTAGTPIAGATVDVWQADDEGLYDVSHPGAEGTGRGLFTTDEHGGYWLRTVTPMDYPVPIDGPPGEMLLAARRPIVRPAHVHFMVTAPGHTKLTTHVFVAGSEHLDSDPVFAVKQSLVRDFTPVDAPDEAATLGVISPFALAVCDFVLAADD